MLLLLLLFENINGDERLVLLLLFAFNFDERGDTAGTLCDVKCEGGPCVGVVEPDGGC